MATNVQRALDLVAAAVGTETVYIAGGSAVAHHLQHRVSRDVDLMTYQPDVDLADVRHRIAREIRDLEVRAETEVALHLLIAGVPVDVVRYPYPLLDPPVDGPAGFKVAALRDLAAMKIAAVARRGIRRDFWDLHEIVTRTMRLEEALDAYHARYGVEASDLYHVLRSLTYFDDAEQEDAWPQGLSADHWAEIKRYFEKAAPAVILPEP
jgi:hypothetical protein